MTKSALEGTRSMTPPPDLRDHLVRALTADLVGPFDQDDPDAREVLHLPPSRWYLTGFLAPDQAREAPEAVDPTTEEELGVGNDEDEEETAGQEPEPKQKKRLPASLGLSVLLPPSSVGQSITVTLSYADYLPEAVKQEGKRPRNVWVRQARRPDPVTLPLEEAIIEQGWPAAPPTRSCRRSRTAARTGPPSARPCARPSSTSSRPHRRSKPGTCPARTRTSSPARPRRPTCPPA
jgi:hypothetical protein